MVSFSRGCSAQYSQLLDNHWNSVVIAMDNLVGNHISGDSGITNIIRQLDNKLSDAIMKAMLMGEDLQKKVSVEWQGEGTFWGSIKGSGQYLIA